MGRGGNADWQEQYSGGWGCNLARQEPLFSEFIISADLASSKVPCYRPTDLPTYGPTYRPICRPTNTTSYKTESLSKRLKSDVLRNLKKCKRETVSMKNDDIGKSHAEL